MDRDPAIHPEEFLIEFGGRIGIELNTGSDSAPDIKHSHPNSRLFRR